MTTKQAAKQSTGAMGKAALMALVAAVALAACNKDVILEGTRFPIRAPLADSIPVDGQPAPVPPQDRAANKTASISLPAAVANAFFDATGKRLRRAPFTPERVKNTLAQQSSKRNTR